MRPRFSIRAVWVSWCLVCLFQTARPAPPELRGLWVDGFHPGINNSNEVTRLLADARAAHFNTLFVQVRRRCDALYESNLEPKAPEITPPEYDPLADLIARAHSGDAPLEVHAWITTYLAWNNRTNRPAAPTHPLRLHPEWLSMNYAGKRWDGQNYTFDPAVPAVQRHVFKVAMDLVSRYDLDGLQFDYIRYMGNDWGYHHTALERFHRLTGHSGIPTPANPLWLEFRRDQISTLLRKVYLSAAEVKPKLKISAATICWNPGVPDERTWFTQSAAYNVVLQDWRSWLHEGILDLAVPMAYFRQNKNRKDWLLWNEFAKDLQYDRQIALGLGAYLNTQAQTLTQLQQARAPSAHQNHAAGIVLYSYHSLATNTTSAKVLSALPFNLSAAIPAMPWKTAPTNGHLAGTIRAAATQAELDGATLQITGPAHHTAKSDATGFFGMVNLPPGEYQVTSQVPGFAPATNFCSVTAGRVARIELNLALPR